MNHLFPNLASPWKSLIELQSSPLPPSLWEEQSRLLEALDLQEATPRVIERDHQISLILEEEKIAVTTEVLSFSSEPPTVINQAIQQSDFSYPSLSPFPETIEAVSLSPEQPTIITRPMLGESDRLYVDTEFYSNFATGQYLMTYFEGNFGQGEFKPRVATLNPETGEIISDTLLATNGVFGRNAYQGPEFAEYAGGVKILYNGKPALGEKTQIFSVELDGTGLNQITDGRTGPHTPVPAKDPTASEVRFGHYILGNNGYRLGLPVFVRGEFDPTVTLVQEEPIGIRGPRWKEGSSRYMISDFEDVDGTFQVIETDTFTGDFKLLTTDSGDKADPEVIWSPELNDFVLIALAEQETAVVVYQETSEDVWERINTITIPDEITGEAKILSLPSTTSFDGNTYIGVSAASPSAPEQDDIYLLDVIGEEVKLKINEEGTSGLVSGPEFFIGGSETDPKLFVGYNISLQPYTAEIVFSESSSWESSEIF